MGDTSGGVRGRFQGFEHRGLEYFLLYVLEMFIFVFVFDKITVGER